MNLTHGVVEHQQSSRPDDYLFRISLKCYIKNKHNQVLIVKESGRDWWDIPGGGMDHGESYRQAIARELEEEVGFKGQFTYRVMTAEDPRFLENHGFWQTRIVFEVSITDQSFEMGRDADEITFIDPVLFKTSHVASEKRIYSYSLLA